LTEELRLKIDNLPDSPGCYLMKHQGEIIYVGKAKNLKNRVRQYFQSSRNHTPKVQAMVDKVDDFEIVLVDGELEAFILECNLIKRHKPFYNILLKDDKHYPYIRIDLKQDFPKVELVRRQASDGARYFGPYMGATVVREMLDVVRTLFPIRTCNRVIRPDKPQRPCVHYEIGQCLAPCAGRVSPEDYKAQIQKVMEFLSGRDEPVMEDLNRQMREAALQMNYERAAVYRDRMRAVETVMQKQKAIIAGGGDQDVLATCPEGVDALVQLVVVRGGKMIGSEHFVLERAGDEPAGEVLESFLLQYYGADNPPPREILLAGELPESAAMAQLLSEIRGGKVVLRTPQRGEKHQMVELAQKNAADAAAKRRKRLSRSHERTIGALEELQSALGLETLPRRIEGYDISNTQGALSVGSMVVMIDGVSANKEYRRFRIKTVVGANDFASMHEIITRRFRHGLQEREERRRIGLDPSGGKFSDMPDLILIDGGRGQLNAALAAMREQGGQVPMFGLAERIDEIVLPDRDEALLLDRRSEALHLVQRLRDEAHRFAITNHRALRTRQSIRSRLEEVPGVGPTRRKALLKHFQTVEKLREADVAALCQVPGMTRPVAEALYAFLHDGSSEPTQL
jgi:excinuclease ABC subunit C